VPEFPLRPLIFVAHPDDETLAFGGLLQRLNVPFVVFATNGAPFGYGLERDFGSLNAYADLRFQEASRVLSYIPNSSFQRLTRSDGSYFSDQHLFEDLPDAAISLRAIVQAYSPDAIVSHAYEGAHIDHDACSFLTMHIAEALSLKRFEFPLYWLDPQGKVIRQQFRDPAQTADRSGKVANVVLEWQLSETEIERKKKMLAEYHTQRGTVSTFAPEAEHMRLATTNHDSFTTGLCRSYMYQNRRPAFYHTRRHRLSAKALLKKFAEFDTWWTKQDWKK
jgi:LmbE family N-acetylglucosaminyl deacetylase